ncbi:carcinoembryonic antigen-related cell adhesion molecule 5-like [Sphaeramia orbicularis]|uniref:Carcinoembryonic antigen-related cell adhesion molecule 5-like n=1 Tax=Sphaeramia orbicularis TaxID=375764 RepID=A0A673CH32_9TELE|nr:carcinoembryonic antigen-related cell adhesion molecule 5-like [Sphaeramia orbicularis]
MGSSVTALIILVILTTYATDYIWSERIYASENPVPVGNDVTLFSQTHLTTGVWLFNNMLLVSVLPNVSIWRSRVLYNSTTSSLTITSLELSDSGIYTLQQVGSNAFVSHLTLSVREPISNVSVNASATNLVEFNDTVVFMCSMSSGTAPSYVWLNGSSVVKPGAGIQFSDGDSKLTIVSVTRYDAGPFKCNVSNGISDGISTSIYLNISYGPNNTTITLMPMEPIYRAGSNILLSCSVVSHPPAVIKWMFNGGNVFHIGSQLHLERVNVSNSGSYKCLCHNTVTSRFSSASVNITVMDPVASVMVNDSGQPAILNDSFTLSCEVEGPVDHIQWWRNGHLLVADSTTVFGKGNKTVTLNRVQHSDGGQYKCQAFNAVSNMTSSPYTLHVNYGPTAVMISGPSMALTGDMVHLNCSSTSYPPSYISWYFNSSLVANSSVYSIGPLTLKMSGTYKCVAYNNITGKNSTAHHMLTVFVPVTSVLIKSFGAQPILNHTFNLTCEAAGSVDSILWMYNDSPLYAGSTRNLSMDNATLTFNPVRMTDNGNYSCKASNPLNSSVSAIFMLDVSYGPKMPTIVGPTTAWEGYKVKFTCQAPSNPPSTYKWFFNNSLVANMSVYETPPLTMYMSGTYTCMAFNKVTGQNSTAHRELTVYGPITRVQIQASTNVPIEDQMYNITCNITGNVDYVSWMRNGERLYADKTTTFSTNNRTVIFQPLGRNDTGNYTCMAINPVGNMTSHSYRLLVNFGPDTPIIQGPHYAEKGHRAEFSCSAMSVPPSNYSWWFNGSLMATTATFTTEPLSLNMTGKYTCVAKNHMLGTNSSSSVMLNVIEDITVMVKANTMPISSKNFTLTCEVIGSYQRIYWMKDNKPMNSTASMSYHIENNTLTFTPVTRYHDGSYQCDAINLAGSNISPPYKLTVNYGPLNVTIKGPYSAAEGTEVALQCSADSQPDCDFRWVFNGQYSDGSSFTFRAAKDQQGNYTCKATNPVTNITMYKTHAFTVAAHASALHIPTQGGLMMMGVFVMSLPVLFH